MELVQSQQAPGPLFGMAYALGPGTCVCVCVCVCVCRSDVCVCVCCSDWLSLCVCVCVDCGCAPECVVILKLAFLFASLYSRCARRCWRSFLGGGEGGKRLVIDGGGAEVEPAVVAGFAPIFGDGSWTATTPDGTQRVWC